MVLHLQATLVTSLQSHGLQLVVHFEENYLQMTVDPLVGSVSKAWKEMSERRLPQWAMCQLLPTLLLVVDVLMSEAQVQIILVKSAYISRYKAVSS